MQWLPTSLTTERWGLQLSLCNSASCYLGHSKSWRRYQYCFTQCAWRKERQTTLNILQNPNLNLENFIILSVLSNKAFASYNTSPESSKFKLESPKSFFCNAEMEVWCPFIYFCCWNNKIYKLKGVLISK